MTGWRLGYIGAPTWIAAACTKIQGQFTAPSSITQAAAAAALEAQPTLVSDMVDAFRRRRALMVDGLSQVQIQGESAMGALRVSRRVGVVWQGLQWKNVERCQRCGLHLWRKPKWLVSGAAFGTPECIRLSYAAADDVLQEAVRRIDAACRQLTA